MGIQSANLAENSAGFPPSSKIIKMRLRTLQLACFVVLLSAFGVAAGRSQAGCRDCVSLHVLLAQIAAVSASEAGQSPVTSARTSHALIAAARTHAVQPWAMRPPAAQSADQHAVTASGL